MARQDREGTRKVHRDGGREEVVVWDPRWKCLEVSGDTNITCFQPYPCFFWSATAVCVSLKQKTRPEVLGREKEAVFQNREDCDALGFQSCCVPLDRSFYLSRQWTSYAKGTRAAA